MAFWFLYSKNRNAAKRFQKGWWGSGKKGKNFLKSFFFLPRSQNNISWEQSFSWIYKDLPDFPESIIRIYSLLLFVPLRCILEICRKMSNAMQNHLWPFADWFLFHADKQSPISACICLFFYKLPSLVFRKSGKQDDSLHCSRNIVSVPEHLFYQVWFYIFCCWNQGLLWCHRRLF